MFLNQINDIKTIDNLILILKERRIEIINKNNDIVIKIKKFVLLFIENKNKFKKYKISEYLKNELHKDYAYINILFYKSQGKTISEYIIEKRIELVKDLLKYNELTLEEISQKTGYSNIAHLCNQFKKMEVISPIKYRKINGY